MIRTFQSKINYSKSSENVDPILVEIIRNSLNSAAEQMKRSLIRTAFSPIIYEVLDFASAIYDKNFCMLSQSPSLPGFMGTLSFCVEASVKEVGGEENLNEGDIILYNNPYGSGSHSQDAAIVMPVFINKNKLIGYTAIKAHWLDTGGKEPYSTDTVDVFQEGTIYPGLKLYKKGKLVEDVYKLIVANSRVPKAIIGDLNAQLNGVKAGARALQRIVNKYGFETFEQSVIKIYEYGEKLVRKTISKIPDGEYVISASYMGFKSFEKNVSIQNQDNFSINIMMIPEAIKMETYVVTASRRRERVEDAPAAISVISKTEIRRESNTNLGDYLKGTKGIDFTQSGIDSYNMTARGFNSSFSSRLLTLTDGRMANVPSLRLTAYNVIPVSFEDVEQIEVVLGPSSALYGPNAHSGVLNIVTSSPLRNTGTSINIQGGMLSQKNTDLLKNHGYTS